MLKAYIVWNADKSEGVIFVENDTPRQVLHEHTVAEDAHYAATGEMCKPVTSSLAGAFVECYIEDQDDAADAGTTIQVVDAAELLALVTLAD